MVLHSSAISFTSPRMSAALSLMWAALSDIPCMEAVSSCASADRSVALSLEVRVRFKTSPTSPSMRPELLLMASSMLFKGFNTCLSMMEMAAKTSMIQSSVEKLLVTMELM